jgi:AraC-like DNA-binding protein
MDPSIVAKTLPAPMCKNCGANYKLNPKRKATAPNQTHTFCSAACRKQYHRYGTSFEQVMRRVDELIDKKLIERSGALSALAQQLEAIKRQLSTLDYVEETRSYTA